jgi:hypothetical protein
VNLTSQGAFMKVSAGKARKSETKLKIMNILTSLLKNIAYVKEIIKFGEGLE